MPSALRILVLKEAFCNLQNMWVALKEACYWPGALLQCSISCLDLRSPGLRETYRVPRQVFWQSSDLANPCFSLSPMASQADRSIVKKERKKTSCIYSIQVQQNPTPPSSILPWCDMGSHSVIVRPQVEIRLAGELNGPSPPRLLHLPRKPHAAEQFQWSVSSVGRFQPSKHHHHQQQQPPDISTIVFLCLPPFLLPEKTER